MQKFFFKLFLLITFLFLSSDMLAQVNWTKYEGNPVITVPGAWYNGAIKSCVIYNSDSSRYEMFFSGSTTASGGRPCRIGLAYSNDGLSWQVRSTPVLTPTAGTWDSYTTEFPFVIIENGVYKMWYTGAQNTATYKIGYATSPDGINWTKHPTPILEAGTDAWEAGGVAGSHIMKDTGGYKLWYWGANTGQTRECIGYATSTDGILWQKDTQNNPILEPGISGEWDDTWVVGPSVMFKDNIYYMWYLGTGATWGQFRIGLATSSDGITNWTKHPANPILKPSPSGWDGGEVESPSVILVGDTLYMYYDGSPSGNYVWQIGLAKSAYVPIPVELISFTTQAENQKVILRWTTATELNNNGFEIQRKVAESDFATVGFVRGEGTTTNQREYSYIDKDLADGKYFYRLKQLDYNGAYEYSNVIEVDVRSLDDYALEQNFPNPFNPLTTIGYVLKEKSNAKLILLNAIGEEVTVLVNAEQDKGYHKVEFNAANHPSGVYFYQLKAGEFMSVKKMLLIK